MNTDQPITHLGFIGVNLPRIELNHFDEITWRQDQMDTHGQTQAIFLRHWDREKMVVRRGPIVLKDFPRLKYYGNFVYDVLEHLGERYSFTDYAALITNLPAWSHIPRHKDTGRIFRLAHRIHVPIVTNPGVVFHCGDQTVHMERGCAYEIGNTNFEHAVDNHSPYDRHHLIVDLLARVAALEAS